MRTVSELKKLSATEVHEAISLDVINCRKGREIELNTQYLERHPEVTEVPDFLLESSKELALYFTIGDLETLLWYAIRKLQNAEIALEHTEHILKEVSKIND